MAMDQRSDFGVFSCGWKEDSSGFRQNEDQKGKDTQILGEMSFECTEINWWEALRGGINNSNIDEQCGLFQTEDFPPKSINQD